MTTIKAYIGYNERTNTYTQATFDIVKELPQIGDITLNGDMVEEVTAIIEVGIDHYGIQEEHYNYDYYMVSILEHPVDESEEPTESYYRIAVRREVDHD